MPEKFRRGIVGVIRNAEGKVLIGEVHDRPGFWQFPQGGIEEGESPRDAFFRELREELGCDRCRILITTESTTRYRWSEPGRDDVVGQEHTWFLGEFEAGYGPDLLKSDGSFRDLRWEEPAALLPLLFEEKRQAFGEGLRLLGLMP
jgi:putative (di)nucleoside polyphosphate hydrolase